ncbi:PIG-L deacetylase family protein [Kineococcus gynurae]|uniref:PIG-L deacetylase family protein n=1 Tax=Kineococcus gynurae TaxID=452979 RepID=A0ABV5LRX9_9ACTN
MVLLGSFAGDVDDPVVVLHAHQDDETLTLGACLEAEADAGRTTITVLGTDGRNSGVRTQLGLTPAKFSAARDAEYLAACAALAVDHVFYAGGLDGALSLEQARAQVSTWVARFPRARFKAQSWIDSHRDHRALGTALFEAWEASGRTLDCRWYVKRDDWDRAPSGAWFQAGGPRVLAAAAEYRKEDPAAGRYGIGYRSVGRSFEELLADNRTLVHTGDATPAPTPT